MDKYIYRAKLDRVVDGDTIYLNGEKIRFTGIDTPELKQTCIKDGTKNTCGITAKQKLINKGTDQVKNILGGLLGGNKTDTTKDTTTSKTDSTKTKDPVKDPIKEGVKGILGNLLKGKSKEKDSTKNNWFSFANVKEIIKIKSDTLININHLPSGIYNIADDEPLSTNELIGLIAQSQNRNPKIWSISKELIEGVASIGAKLHLPLNTESLHKLSSSYVVSNTKIKAALGKPLPTSSKEGLMKTFRSFLNWELLFKYCLNAKKIRLVLNKPNGFYPTELIIC